MTEYKTQAGGHSATTTTWQDLSGNGNNGTLQGGKWQTNGLLLDGTNDGVKINRQDLITMTVEMTYTPKTISSGEVDLLANYEAGGYGLNITNRKTKICSKCGWNIHQYTKNRSFKCKYNISYCWYF